MRTLHTQFIQETRTCSLCSRETLSVAGILTAGEFCLHRSLVRLFSGRTIQNSFPKCRGFVCKALKAPTTFIMQLHPCNTPCITDFFLEHLNLGSNRIVILATTGRLLKWPSERWPTKFEGIAFWKIVSMWDSTHKEKKKRKEKINPWAKQHR